MKPTEITMQIVKNLGNYETCRLEATYTLDDKDDLTQSFITARKQLETAYEKAYGIKPEKPDNHKIETLKTLTLTSPEFDRVCKALYEGRTYLREIEKFFIIDKDVSDYFTKHNLI